MLYAVVDLVLVPGYREAGCEETLNFVKKKAIYSNGESPLRCYAECIP